VQFNHDMRSFVVDKKMAPSEARLEIRRINAEVLKLILGAVGTFYASAGGAMGGVGKPPQVPTATGTGRPGVERQAAASRAAAGLKGTAAARARRRVEPVERIEGECWQYGALTTST
jgi:hypothetical protein